MGNRRNNGSYCFCLGGTNNDCEVYIMCFCFYKERKPMSDLEQRVREVARKICKRKNMIKGTLPNYVFIDLGEVLPLLTREVIKEMRENVEGGKP